MKGSRRLYILLLLLGCISILLMGGALGSSDITVVDSNSAPAIQTVFQTDEETPNQTPDSSVRHDGNTVEYLALSPDDIEHTSFEQERIDVAAAVGQDAGEARASYLATEFETRMRAAETAEDERQAIETVATAIDHRSQYLQQSDEAAIEEFATTSITGTEFYRTVSIGYAEANALIPLIRQLDAENDEVIDSPVSATDLATYRVRLEPLTGPVRNEISRNVQGQSRNGPVYIQASQTGITLAYLEGDGDRFVREAHLTNLRDPASEDQLGFSGAESRFEELYPWVVENNAGLNTFVVGGQPYLHHAGVYAVSAAHDHGFRSPEDLTLYLDGGTADVFYETQQQDPEQAAIRGDTAASDSYELIVNWTRPGWPVAVAVVDPESEELVNAEITLNDEQIGSTNGDRLWFIGEQGSQTIEASVADETIELDVALM